MERDWSGNARRLSHADRSEIERLIWGGETFEAAATAVGLLDQVDPARSGAHGRLEAAGKGALCSPLVAGRAGGDFARPDGWEVSPNDREAAEESTFDDLARRGLGWIAQPLSRVASRQRGGRARPQTQAFETSDRLEVVP
jgi:hypothetical protein